MPNYEITFYDNSTETNVSAVLDHLAGRGYTMRRSSEFVDGAARVDGKDIPVHRANFQSMGEISEILLGEKRSAMGRTGISVEFKIKKIE